LRRTVISATLLALLAAVAPAAQAKTPGTAASITIDFSTVNQGPFDQSFFKDDGAIFTEGDFVSGVQGNNSLMGPVAARVRGGFKSASAQVAPANQGTATYKLTAYKQGHEIATTAIAVTQDSGDPATDPFGYFTINIGPLPKKADSFSLSNVFSRSSFTNVSRVEFGVNSVILS
jgi:hypothetical protein